MLTPAGTNRADRDVCRYAEFAVDAGGAEPGVGVGVEAGADADVVEFDADVAVADVEGGACGLMARDIDRLSRLRDLPAFPLDACDDGMMAACAH